MNVIKQLLKISRSSPKKRPNDYIGSRCWILQCAYMMKLKHSIAELVVGKVPVDPAVDRLISKLHDNPSAFEFKKQNARMITARDNDTRVEFHVYFLIKGGARVMCIYDGSRLESFTPLEQLAVGVAISEARQLSLTKASRPTLTDFYGE